MPFVPVPGRMSRRKLDAYKDAVASRKWWEVVMDKLDVFLSGGVEEDTVFMVKHPSTGAMTTVSGEVVGNAIIPNMDAYDSLKCPGGVVGCLCRANNGAVACSMLNQWASVQCLSAVTGVSKCICANSGYKACAAKRRRQLRKMPVGAFRLSDFSGSPQLHAILNRHLTDYFKGVNRSRETTPYHIPASQEHLLADLGMEQPMPDAPVVPHGLHKSIEEAQLRRMRAVLPSGDYGLTCVKSSKVHLLPPCGGSPMNPLREARDVSRFPGSAIADSDFSKYNTQFAHDVAGEVTPHELVEKLIRENPDAQLFVTGMLPAEILERATTFEPSSHMIEYEGDGYNCVFTGSEAESYFTPLSVGRAWLNSSSIVGSNGRTYHVVLLDYKLGHCLFHLFCGDVTEQHTRTFPTGSMVKLPAAVTGTFSAEYFPQKLLVSTLDFVSRTPDLSTRNLAAKVSMVANAVNPRTTARERWIMRHVMAQLAPVQTWGYQLRRAAWNVLYAFTFQWHMLTETPDIFQYVNERKRFFTIHPTQGGGWMPQMKFMDTGVSIPNSPTVLQQVSTFTAWAFTFVLPKLIIGEMLSMALWHLRPVQAISKVWSWFQPEVLRLILTAATALAISLVPSNVSTAFVRCANHFSRQLWWRYDVQGFIKRAALELTGAPGSLLARTPGHGWAWQALIWAVALHSVVPGLVPALVVPWIAYSHGWGWLMTLWIAAVGVENLLVCMPVVKFGVPRNVHITLTDLLTTVPDDLACDASEFLSCKWHNFSRAMLVGISFVQRALRGFVVATGNCSRVPTLSSGPPPEVPSVVVRRVDRPLPVVVVQPNLPIAPVGINMAVPIDGLNFPDWLRQVENAYVNAPPLFPALTPGQSCFWDSLASLGGTPHMWFSWYMSFMRRVVPANAGVVGNVTVMDMHTFAGLSGVGLRLSGLVDEVTVAQQGRPTLSLLLTMSTIRNELHVEPALVSEPSFHVSAYARLLSTILVNNRQWHTRVVQEHAVAPIDSIPIPTPELKAIMGDHPIPRNMNEIGDAINAAFVTSPFTAAMPNGYALVFAPLPPPVSLFTYGPPLSRARVARKGADKIWQGFKVGASSRQQVDNATRNNPTPAVPMWVSLMNELRAKVSDYMGFWLPCTPLRQETVQYTADVERAARLVADLKAHPAVLNGKATPAWLQSLDSVVDLWRKERTSRTVPVHCFFGVSGCGKTTATAAYLRGLPDDSRFNSRIVSHTESLRAQSKSALDFPGMRGVNFPTLAGLLSEPSCGPIVFDDAGKFWGGVLDLAILANPLVPEVVVNGDPCQGLGKFPVGGTQSEFDEGPMVIAKQTKHYATLSHRAFGLLTESFGIHTTNPVRGHITHTVGGKQGLPVTTASPRYVQVLSASGREARTHDTIQGEDFNSDVEVDMSALEDAMSDRTAYVALSRSKTGVYLHMNAADPRSVIKSAPSGSDLLNSILYSLRADGSSTLFSGNELIRATFYAHMHSCMPNLAWFMNVGASLGAAAYQSVVEACETTFVSEGDCLDRPSVAYAVPAAPVIDKMVPETHWVDREFRELRRAGVTTDQFAETKFVNPHVHKRHDNATYRLTVDKRVVNGTRARNLIRKHMCPRTDMITELERLVVHFPKWTPEKHQHYVDKARIEYESGRSAGAVEAKLAAHDPERSNKDVVNSLKAQVIKKDEKRKKLEAIPGQMIWEYDIAHTLEDAAYTLFLEEELFDAFPSNFLFYRRMNPEKFIAEYKKRWRVNNGIHTSDVTRWDYGCDAGVLNFDEHLMVRCGFPLDYVRAYVDRRLETKTQHGVVQTTQPSGDRYTWTLNSIRRAVVASILHSIRPEDTVAINGDDEAMDRCSDGGTFPDSPWEFKDQNGYRGEFSGFELGGPVPEYSASGILYRTHILVTRDPSASEKWVNYMSLLALADCDTAEAAEVAQLAKLHMSPGLFASHLPKQLRATFL